ncbi:Rv3235 family protein [Nocardia wallacei]|uniref:Rv3235 family protein n=1 Tax=Nocardia wallacei TaxID=480035 RepID=UPI0024580B82|nr:Rv3235 family protein [Nocardia wallacei]
MSSRRRSLSRAPNFEPPLDDAGDSGHPVRHGGPASRATLPCHRASARGLVSGAPGRAPRRSPHDGRSTSYPAEGEIDSGTKRFAERSLRLVLEVVDGRRPVAQLRPVAEPTVLAAVRTLVRPGAAERRRGPAGLASVRTTIVAPGTAEVCGGYDRGNRRFAVAARIVVRRGEWRLAALRLR